MKKVIELINSNKVFKNVRRVGVGVSGGVDSISLLSFLSENK